MNKNIKKLASVVTVASLSLTTVVASNELLSSVNAQETANTKEESKQETTNVSADVFENEAGAVIRVTANADVKNVKTNYAVDSGQNRFILLGDLKSGEVREIQVSLAGDYNYKVLPKTSVVADKVDFSSEIRGHKIKGSVTFEVEDSKACVSKEETPKEETPKEETPKVNPVDAGMPTNAKWTRSQLQEWGYGMGTITGNYAVDGDLGLFNSHQAMENGYNKGSNNLDDQLLNGTMSGAQYDKTPHGYFWSKITHNGQDGYKVSLYDKDGKYNAPETPKVETPKEETPKEETPKVETPKVETPTTPEVNPVDAGMPAEAKWSRSDLQNLGYEIGTVTGNYKVDGDLGLFNSQQAMENAYNKGADNVGDLYLNDKITDAQYDNAPHGYSWTKVTYNGQDSYKVSVYDKNGKYNVPGK